MPPAMPPEMPPETAPETDSETAHKNSPKDDPKGPSLQGRVGVVKICRVWCHEMASMPLMRQARSRSCGCRY